jgi:hypothetical protein
MGAYEWGRCREGSVFGLGVGWGLVLVFAFGIYVVRGGLFVVWV